MTAWPQQNADPFASSHIPSILTSTHARNPQHQHLRGSNLWCQNISTVTSIPPMSPPLANAAHGTHHDSAAFTTDIESSHTSPERRSTSGSGSACLGYECQGQSGYRMNGYAPQPPNLDPHHQLWCANCCSAAQMTPAQGAPLKLWAPNHWNGLKMDSASSQGSHGAWAVWRTEIVVACRGVRALGDEGMGVPVTKLGIFQSARFQRRCRRWWEVVSGILFVISW